MKILFAVYLYLSFCVFVVYSRLLLQYIVRDPRKSINRFKLHLYDFLFISFDRCPLISYEKRN